MISVERNLIISLLKLTQKTGVLLKDVKDHSKLPTETTYMLLEKFQSENLLNLNNQTVEVSIDDRLKLAVKAVSLGADVQTVSDLLCWQEFEEIAIMALRNNGFAVAKNVRFSHGGRKWEIDAVGCKRPLVVCIDCKHWGKAISASVLGKIAQAQAYRAKALSEFLPAVKLQLECTKWEKAQFVPAILSLVQGSFKFYDDIPIVPVLQLQDFLCQLPAYMYQLKAFPKVFDHLG
ncbi:MAG: restriction endonuclease [Candidatus Bathyarchaeia archaeon]|jgi:hypothetical protein